jgi:hypothetical protein
MSLPNALHALEIERSPALALMQHIERRMGCAPWHLVVGKRVFLGPPRAVTKADIKGAVPSRAVFCHPTGGRVSEPWNDGGMRSGIDRPTVQVWVRSEPNDFTGGLELARAVLDAVDMRPPPGFFECRAASSEPLWVRKDDQGQHEWTINTTLHIVRAS